MKNYFFLLVFGMLFASCESKPSLKEYMTDSWQTTYLKITFQKSDSTEVFEDKFDKSPTITAQSKYNSDGTFVTWYLGFQGEKLNETPGKWSVEGDSLYVEYDYEGKTSRIAYHIKQTEEGFEGTSKHDWDEDGESDDLLLMKTKRIVLDKE